MIHSVGLLPMRQIQIRVKKVILTVDRVYDLDKMVGDGESQRLISPYIYIHIYIYISTPFPVSQGGGRLDRPNER